MGVSIPVSIDLLLVTETQLLPQQDGDSLAGSFMTYR
jgi:hypothetical protein